MARSVSLIKQHDATKLFKAARAAGFDTAKILLHPDGTVEASGSMFDEDSATAKNNKSSWDDVL
ncbi:hypothetical protein ACLBWZ_14365 [Brucellaceae bacterium C25G]